MIVFDLDGTLADTSHRAHFVERPKGQKDWDSFHAAAKDDLPNWPILELYWDLSYGSNARIEIWTGRDDRFRQMTLGWLDEIGISNPNLRMRPTGTHTHDDKMKEAWLKEFGPVSLAFEDRQRVVDMWRRNGVTCCQVAPGDF